MKTLFKFAFVAAIVAVAGYNVYKSQSVMNGMSDFALANVEALADGENSGSKHTLECESSGIKACSGTCNKCNVTLTAYGNGRVATLICYQ